MIPVLLTFLGCIAVLCSVVAAKNEGARSQSARGHSGPVPVGALLLGLAGLVLAIVGTWVELA